MKRRAFLRFLAAVGIASFERTWRRTAAAARYIAPFHIAGVRFQAPPRRPQTVGDRLLLVRGAHDGKTCYAIYTADWDRLGFVPGALVPALRTMKKCPATLSAVDAHALPWKRYQVTIETAQTTREANSTL